MMDVNDSIPLRDIVEGMQLTINSSGIGTVVLRKENGEEISFEGVYLDCTMILDGDEDE